MGTWRNFGETGGAWSGESGVLEHKSGNISETTPSSCLEQKILWTAFRNSPTLFRMVLSPISFLFPKIGGSQPPPKTAIAIISGTGKATDFKFRRYIQRVYSNKNPLINLAKRERGRFRDCPNFWGTPIISETGKATNFRFCTHIHKIDRKKPIKNFGKSCRGRTQVLYSAWQINDDDDPDDDITNEKSQTHGNRKFMFFRRPISDVGSR